jgi:hypothetical protein
MLEHAQRIRHSSAKRGGGLLHQAVRGGKGSTKFFLRGNQARRSQEHADDDPRTVGNLPEIIRAYMGSQMDEIAPTSSLAKQPHDHIDAPLLFVPLDQQTLNILEHHSNVLTCSNLAEHRKKGLGIGLVKRPRCIPTARRKWLTWKAAAIQVRAWRGHTVAITHIIIVDGRPGVKHLAPSLGSWVSFRRRHQHRRVQKNPCNVQTAEGLANPIYAPAIVHDPQGSPRVELRHGPTHGTMSAERAFAKHSNNRSHPRRPI